TLSHEVAETITDADPRLETPGIRVTPGSLFDTSTDPNGNNGEVSDFEAENYTARVNGAMLQSYLGRNGQFIIPDGGPATIFVDTNGVVNINGGQSGSGNDTITFSVKGQEEIINLNGQVFDLPLPEIRGVTYFSLGVSDQ